MQSNVTRQQMADADTLARYTLHSGSVTIDDKVSKSAYGEVRLGTLSVAPLLVNKKVAINVVAFGARDQSTRDNFRNEVLQLIHSTATVDHPVERGSRICRYYGMFTCQHNAYVVMKRYKQSLQQHIHATQPPRGLPMEECLRIGVQMAEGLQSLHACGVTAQDLKPDNVLMDGKNNIVLCNFGVSKIIRSMMGAATPTQINGTPNYMSPEQWNNEAQITNRADSWALGATLLHMLTGSPPFAQWQMQQIMLELMVKRRGPQIPDWLSSELKSLLRDCFSIEPVGRPTATQLVQRMQALLAQQPQQQLAHGASRRALPLAAAASPDPAPIPASAPALAPIPGLAIKSEPELKPELKLETKLEPKNEPKPGPRPTGRARGVFTVAQSVGPPVATRASAACKRKQSEQDEEEPPAVAPLSAQQQVLTQHQVLAQQQTLTQQLALTQQLSAQQAQQQVLTQQRMQEQQALLALLAQQAQQQALEALEAQQAVQAQQMVQAQQARAAQQAPSPVGPVHPVGNMMIGVRRIGVMNQQGYEVLYTLQHHTKLKKVMTDYCLKVGRELNSMKFCFDANRVQCEDTPFSLRMEDGDVIDAFPIQIGT